MGTVGVLIVPDDLAVGLNETLLVEHMAWHSRKRSGSPTFLEQISERCYNIFRFQGLPRDTLWKKKGAPILQSWVLC